MFYQLTDDLYVPDRWHLDSPRVDRVTLPPNCFSRGQRENVSGVLSVAIETPGVALDYTEAALDVPVLSERAANALARVAGDEVQLIPVRVEGLSEPYFIGNATGLVDCVDEAGSAEARKWSASDGRPDRIGHYRSIIKLRVRPEAASGRHFFRVQGWRVALIVSDAVKAALQAHAMLGARFTGV